ncbi:MAG: galactokinase [Deltaproteobacteria bacterium HGW-Deltaproteobacteria-10]|nr:MAG: galactokinase [Deltaproteobacteria bacterium HGW-Deltaproteobacteria-10]
MMCMNSELAKIDVVILCGGLGTRLRAISPDMPKALMPFAGRPFIDILIESLLPFGFRRFVLCVGHLREKIRENFQARDYDVVFSEEEEPLGTGGALKNAASIIGSSSFLAMNGDSICPVDFSRFHSFHIQKDGIVSLVLAEPLPGQDYGAIEVDGNQRVISFKEKKECRNTMFINGGIYLMKRDVFGLMPALARFSLENDFFPKIISEGCYGFRTNAEVIDIGTPERYLYALQRLSVHD